MFDTATTTQATYGGPGNSAQAMTDAMQSTADAAVPRAERLPGESLWRMYQAWETAKAEENIEMYDASKYYHGKQYTDKELKILKRRGQPPTVKNRIRRKIDFLVGVEQRLRRDPKAFPRNPEGEAAAPIATAVLRSVQDAAKWPAIASECSRDALIRGIGVQWAGITKDRKGRLNIRKHQVKGDRWFYDPRSEEWDFSDALYVGEAQWIDIELAKELLPWAGETIDQLGEYASGNHSRSALPQLFDKERNWVQWVDAQKRRIFLVSIWYRYCGVWLFDFIVGSISLCPPEMDCQSPYIDENDATTHPYRAWSPYVGEDGTRYGMIRDMKPIQDEINKRSSRALHLITTRRIKATKGAVDDVDKARTELAKPDGYIEINPGGTFEPLLETSEVQGNLELMQEAKAEIENLGPNPGLLGRGVEKQSGRAILAQQNSGMTELSPVFERMREWKLRVYHHDWNLVRKFYTDDRYIRITGDPEAAKHLRINVPVTDQFGNIVGAENVIADMDVDIILDEGPDTVTMREELIEMLSDRQDIPVEILIELSSVSDKDALLKKLAQFKAPPPEMQQAHQRMAQLEEAKAAADIDKVQADAESTRAGTTKALAEIMVPPQAMGQFFPIHYREPSFLDKAVQNFSQPPMPNALAGGPPPDQPPQMAEPPQGPVPPNGMEPGPQVQQEDYLAQMAPYPDPRMMSEPQLGEKGGLPIGPM